MAKHFNEGNHNIDDFEIIGIEVVKEDSVTYRRLRETDWIKKLGTAEHGENKKHF